MTKEEIKNTPEIVELMLSESVMPESKEKLHKRLDEICNLAIKALEQEPEWIPVSERLPKPYEQVLRTVKSFGWNCTDKTHVDIDSICPIDTNVIAWKPLPEPYKAESEVEE